MRNGFIWRGKTYKIKVGPRERGETFPPAKLRTIIIGEAYRNGGCWFISDPEPDKYDDSRICAWGLNEKVYVGPSPATPAAFSIVYSGSRVGMYEEIASRQGIDTSAAKIITKASRDGAVTFCREYARDYSPKCINEQLRAGPSSSVLRGNCKEKTFVDFNGRKYVFLGKPTKSNENISAEYYIRDLESGEILDGSSASGYGVALGIYQALCPATAPKADDAK